MPLMVDSLGQPVYGDQPSVYTFDTVSTNAQAGPSSLVAAAPLPSASSFNAGDSMSSLLDSQAKAREEILHEQKAIQAGLDSQTPRNLMLAFAVLLLLCMLFTHNRFLARLFASKRRKANTSRFQQYASDLPINGNSRRPVGGGDLFTGWLLKKGFGARLPLSPMDDMALKSNPFASPLDRPITPITPMTPSTPLPSSPASRPPPHIIPFIQYLPFSSILYWAPLSRFPSPFASPANLCALVLISLYLALCGFALIWRSDITPTTDDKGYGYDFMRTGLVAVTQIPLVVALGVRGNIVGLCVGKGYEKLKIFHKIVGRILFLSASLHSAFHLHRFATTGTLANSMSKGFNIWGTVAWCALILIIVSSIPAIRQKAYTLFKVCHIIGMIGMLVGLCFHVKVCIPWCIAGLVIYLISIVCTVTKTRLAHGEFVALRDSYTTVVTIPSLQSGWRAGQHVRLRVPSLPFPLNLQAHPFTIASAPDGEGMVLMCKAAGDWTSRLYNFANQHASSNAYLDKARQGAIAATVIVEGPHGGLGNTMLSSFGGVMLVAGGSGITQALSLAHDLINKAPSGVVRPRTIDLVWIVKTEDVARPLMPTLLDMVEDAKRFEEQCLEGRKLRRDLPSPVGLRVKIHVTRCPISSPLTLLTAPPEFAWDPFVDSPTSGAKPDRPASPATSFSPSSLASPLEKPSLKRQPSEAEREKAMYLSRNASTSTYGSASSTMLFSKTNNRSKYYTTMSGIDVSKRRPNMADAVGSLVDEVIERQDRMRLDPSGVCITVCGPLGLVNNVREKVMQVETSKRRKVGGIELEEEYFGY